MTLRTNPCWLKAMTRPDAVAIIGASDSASKLQSRPMRFMRQHGFKGAVYPVNPARATVLGVTAYPTLAAIGRPIEHAYILLDGEAAITALGECAAAGVAAVSVLADGFAESGAAGAQRQARLVAQARESGILLIGPNSTGLVDTRSGFSCTTNAAFATDSLRIGRLAVISQSGSLIGTVYSRGDARGLAFSSLISVGNEAAFGVGEIGEILLDDPDTDGFLLFMETVRQPARIAHFARRAHALGKPVVCYMIGRSSEGQALSVSHTGAMTGSAQAVSSFLKSHGIREVDNFEALLEAPSALLKAAGARQRPRTVTVVSTTGGGGAMVIDRLGERGVSIAACSPASRATLSARKIPLGHGKLVDVTLAGARYESMLAVVDTLIRDPQTGVLVVAIGSSAQFQPELAVKPIIDAMAGAPADCAPVLAMPLPQADASLALLTQAGIPAFRTVESCAETVALVLGDGAPEPLGAALADCINPNVDQCLREIINRARLAGASRPSDLPSEIRHSLLLNEVQAAEIFERLGIARPSQRVLGPTDLLPTPLGIEFPVAAKLVSAQIAHKSEMGAIRIGLADHAALKAALDDMKQHIANERPPPELDAVLIQTMQTGVAEILIGLTRDPLVGPVITVGIGGTATEIYRDTAVRPAPLAKSVALTMLHELRAFALLDGFRGRQRADLNALADAIVAVSTLAAYSTVLEAEINPLLVRAQGQGVVLLDALISIDTGAAADEAANNVADHPADRADYHAAYSGPGDALASASAAGGTDGDPT